MPYKYNPYAIKDVCLDCNQQDFCLEWSEFVEKQSSPERKPNYAHFDNRRYLNELSVLRKVMNPAYVKSHSFYPLIRYVERRTRCYIRDGNLRTKEKNREISYCSYIDRAIYQRYSFIINYHYNIKLKELGINDVPIAYRTNLNGRSNIHFAKEAFDFIKKQKNAYILVGDFKGFFDNLNHEYLKKMLCSVLDFKYLPDDFYAVYKNITRYSYWEWKHLLMINRLIHSKGATTQMNSKANIITQNQFKNHTHMIKKNSEADNNWKNYGIPQGTPISAVLSNVYMVEFDKIVNSYVKALKGEYMRYSDDFIIILPRIFGSQTENIKKYIFELVKTIDKDSIETTGLQIHEDKTKEYYFDGEFIRDPNGEIAFLDYLGFIFNGEKIKIRRKSITKYYYRMNRKAKSTRIGDGITYKGNKISMGNLYEIYSERGKKTNFIDYLKRANQILELDDRQAQALLNNHMTKIAIARKKIN